MILKGHFDLQKLEEEYIKTNFGDGWYLRFMVQEGNCYYHDSTVKDFLDAVKVEPNHEHGYYNDIDIFIKFDSYEQLLKKCFEYDLHLLPNGVYIEVYENGKYSDKNGDSDNFKRELSRIKYQEA